MKRLRILMSAFCCDAYDVSEDLDGFNWVKHLARHCDITLFTLGRPGRRCGTEDMEGVTTYRFPQTWLGRVCPELEKTLLPSYPPFMAYALWKAACGMRRERYDLVHQVTPAALRFPSSMAMLRLPFILGPVGGGVTVPDAFRKDIDEPFYFRLRGLDRMRMRLDPALAFTLRKASRILVQGEYAVELLPEWARGKAVVMLGSGVESLPPAVERPARQGELRILYVGRVVAAKGLRFVLRALERLDERLKWRLTVVGDGPDMETVKGLARRLEGRGEITFTGWLPREAAERQYDRADAFCFPSLREAGGNAVLEAMSHGLPAIVMDNGGPATTVTDECGFRVAARNPDQVIDDVAAALRALAGSPDLRVRMGEAARRRVESEYLWSVKVERMLAIYEEAIARRAAAGGGR